MSLVVLSGAAALALGVARLPACCLWCTGVLTSRDGRVTARVCYRICCKLAAADVDACDEARTSSCWSCSVPVID